jgi:phytoene dehydrogenase-like protein
MFDIVIIGGGIAGLTVAEQCAKHERVLILERYPSWGGRIVTSHEPYEYEIGAGRIHTSHLRVKKLIKRFNLKTFPISTESNFEREENDFYELFEPLRQELSKLQKRDLATNTIADLVPKAMHPIFKRFPYYAELYALRADIALDLFANSKPMGTNAEFIGIQGGIDQLTNGLVQVLNKNPNIELRTRHRVKDIKQINTNKNHYLFEITGSKGKKAEAEPFTIQAKRIVIATEYRTFKDFSILKKAQFVNHLTDSPLIRIYAAYPLTELKNTAAWFHDIKKTVTNSPLRFIIPINAKTGVIMISYTDGEDTNTWREKQDDELKTAIQKEIRKLFPEKTIPEPTYIKKHDWLQGCTYWKKGDYNMDKTLLEAQNPLKNIYICGESVNRTQSWIESSLESAELLCEKLNKNSRG